MASFFDVIYGLVLCVLAVAIIGSNSFCIIVLRKVQSINDAPKIFMISLTVADLLMGVIGVFPTAMISFLADDDSILNEISMNQMCKFEAVLLKSIYIVKVFSLLALNIDRYIAVTRALRYQTIVTYKRALIGTASVWLLSLIASLISGAAVNWEVYVQQFSMCIFVVDVQQFLVWLDVILLVMFPFIQTIVIYIRLSALARHHAAQIAALPMAVPNYNNNRQPAQHQAAKKASKTFHIMTIVFAMSWAPLLVTSLLANMITTETGKYIPVFEEFLKCFLIISFCSGFCNIIVYFYRNSEIRAAGRAILIPICEPFQQFILRAYARLQQFSCHVCPRTGKNNSPLHTFDATSEDQSINEMSLNGVQEPTSPTNQIRQLTSPRNHRRQPTSPRNHRRQPTSPRNHRRQPTSPRNHRRQPTSPRNHRRQPTSPRNQRRQCGSLVLMRSLSAIVEEDDTLTAVQTPFTNYDFPFPV